MKRRNALRAVAASLVAMFAMVLVAPFASAQSDEGMLAVREIDGTDKDNIHLTFLYTGATDDLDGLTIREDGESMAIKDITNLRRTGKNLATVYVVDTSASMDNDGQLSDVKKGLKEVAGRLSDGDEVALVSFNDAPIVETNFTGDAGQLEDAIDEMTAPKDGKTAMWDAIRKATTLFEGRPDLQPNIVLVADGADDASTATLESARASVVASGAGFFTVELDHEDAVERAALRTIIDRAGGAAFTADPGESTEAAFDDVSAAILSQYVATYASAVDQGQVDVAVSVGNVERKASYVAGASVQGAQTAEVAAVSKPIGPEWLRGTLGWVLALALVGLAVGLGVFAFGSLVTSTDESLNAVLSPYSEGPIVGEAEEGALAQTALLQRAVELTEEFAERQGFLVKVEHALERADLPLRAAEAMFFYVAGALLLTLLAFTLGGFVTGLAVMLLCGLVPPAVVNFMASRRAKAFQAQLPDTLSLLSGSLRAGYSLMQGIEAVSKEVAEPMGKELRRVITEARLGREVEDAMDAVAERMDSPDFSWAVMAIRIQREVGGNLSELLLTVADTMIHRERLRRDVSALTAEGKISAIILGLLPIGLGAFMWLSNPEYMSPLGATTLGHILLGAATLSGLAGFAWMKKIINIEV